MKFITLLLLFISTISFAQLDSIPDGKYGTDYNVTDASGKKQGYWVRVYEEGNIYYTGQFSDGEPKGKFAYFYKSGELMNIAVHEGEGLTNSTAYRRDGTVISTGSYLSQKKTGEWKYYNESAVVLSIENYDNDLLQGENGVYYNNGQLAEKWTYDKGIKHGPYEEYFENGKPKGKGNYSNGKLHGDIVTYQGGNAKLYEGQLRDGVAVGEWRYYLEDGKLKLRILYDDNGTELRRKMENGEVEDYYPSGIPKSYVEYKNGELHGIFEEFYDIGDFVRQEVISAERGQPIEFKETLENTQLQREGEYRMGKLHGEIIYYNEDGTIQKRENYENGELID